MKNTDKISYQIDKDILKVYHFNMKLCTITDTSYLISFLLSVFFNWKLFKSSNNIKTISLQISYYLL